MPSEVPAEKPRNPGADTEIVEANSDTPAKEARESTGSSKAALLAEFTGLKIEQTQRVFLREISVYLSLFVNTTITAIYALQSHDPRLLLLIPFASALLFWIYAANDSTIKEIRRYILSRIVPGLAGAADANSASVLGWDELHRRGFIGRWIAKIIRFVLLWATFSGASIAGVAINAPEVQDMSRDLLWLAAAAFTGIPYLLALWLR